jgi:hypothetical protein
MAGGLWLLGSAVASADEQVANAGGGTEVTQTDSGSGSNGNLSSNSASAENVQVTKVETDVDGGDGGGNEASVNTGVITGGPVYGADSLKAPNGEHHDDGTSVTLNTGDVHVNQEANGGDVNNSGNVAVAGGGDQTAIANATTDVTQTSTGDEHHGDHHGDGPHGDGPQALGMGNDHHDGGNFNYSENNASAENKDITRVETDVNGGDGGENYAQINTGIIGNFYCEKGGCVYNITTGDVWLNQEANGGSVNNSGNVGIGVPAPGSASPCVCHKAEESPAPEVKPAVRPASRHMAAAPVLSSAQPSGQLAFTGSDVSLPLTVGLVALAAGIGLTAAGRRRETQTV